MVIAQLTSGQEALVDKAIKWFDNYQNGIMEGPHPEYFAYSGAAGTGKTTVMMAIIDKLGLNRNQYIACAYVGKAVLQLQKRGLSAKTIHSTIYDLIYEKGYTLNGEQVYRLKFVLKEKLPEEYKLIVVDEATMVNDDMRDQLLSFGLPIIFMGDMNQLPPIFGYSSVMTRPNHVLTEIMRQNEDDPIVILSQQVLHDIPLMCGQYGLSKVVDSYSLDRRLLTDYDQILTNTNKLRSQINDFVRRELFGYMSPEPRLDEKVVCRQNNWQIMANGYSLTNGLTGIITDISRRKVGKGYYIIDFKPDMFDNDTEFLGLRVNADYLRSNLEEQREAGRVKFEKFEYAYAITVYSAQGSEYDRVLFFDSFFRSDELTKKARYTAITRAKKAITVVKSSDVGRYSL